MRARNRVEGIVKGLLITSSTIAIFTTIGIVLSVLFEAIRFFQAVPFLEFVFGLEWRPQIAIRADQVGSSGAFGMIPLLAGTMLISLIAMVVAVPIGLMSAIYLSEFASPKFRAVAKPTLEVLAGIPTVCGSLREALECLAADHDFLLAGDVFTKDQIEGYLELKWEEVYAYEHTPHPMEFKMYYSC